MMKWLSSLCLAAVTLCTAGCLAPPPSDSFQKGTVTHARSIVTGFLMRDKEPITTKQIVRLKVEYQENGRDRQFDVLMGPYPYTGAVTDAVGWFDANGPRFHVQSSWILVAGDWPMVETDMVEGTSGGSTLVAQIDDTSAPTKHRIYLLSKTGKEYATVLLKADRSIKKSWVADVDRYVEHLAGSGVLGDPLPVASDADLKTFIDYVKERAKEAGVLEAGTISGP